MSNTSAIPGSNPFRCTACGRFFLTKEDLSAHEVECRATKRSTDFGVAELEKKDAEEGRE